MGAQRMDEGQQGFGWGLGPWGEDISWGPEARVLLSRLQKHRQRKPFQAQKTASAKETRKSVACAWVVRRGMQLDWRFAPGWSRGWQSQWGRVEEPGKWVDMKYKNQDMPLAWNRIIYKYLWNPDLTCLHLATHCKKKKKDAFSTQLKNLEGKVISQVRGQRVLSP